MIQAYINKIEYYLPPQKESNANLLKIAGKDKYKIKKIIKKIGIKNPVLVTPISLISRI